MQGGTQMNAYTQNSHNTHNYIGEGACAPVVERINHGDCRYDRTRDSESQPSVPLASPEGQARHERQAGTPGRSSWLT